MADKVEDDLWLHWAGRLLGACSWQQLQLLLLLSLLLPLRLELGFGGCYCCDDGPII